MEEKMPKLHGETVLSEEWDIMWGRIFMMAIWIALNKLETRNLNNNNNINNNNNNSKSDQYSLSGDGYFKSELSSLQQFRVAKKV